MTKRQKKKKDRMAWMPLYVDDFIGSAQVARLTAEQRGVYITLLMRQWQLRGEGLPDDVRELRRLAAWSAPRGFDRVWAALQQFFPLCDDARRRNARLHDVFGEQVELASSSREKGAAGGAAAKAAAEIRKKAGELDNEVRPEFATQNVSAKVGQSTPQVVDNQRIDGPSRLPSSKQISNNTTTTKSVVVVPNTATTTGWIDDEVRAVIDKLDEAAHRQAVIAFLVDRPPARRRAFLATLEALNSGLGGRGGKAATWWQIGEGVVDAIASATGDITANMLRAFVAKAPAAPTIVAVTTSDTAVVDDPSTMRDDSGAVVWHSGMPEHLRPH